MCAVYGPTTSVWGLHSVGGEELLDVLYSLVQFVDDVVGDKFFQGVGSG